MIYEYQTALVKKLIELSIIFPEHVELYSTGTRDDPKQHVWRCDKTGVVFLEPRLKGDKDTEDLSYWGVDDRKKFLETSSDDDERRYHFISEYLPEASFLDIGTGLGGILDRALPYCRSVAAVEPQSAARKTLQKLGYSVYSDIADIEQREFDLITLFHVFEHLHDPMLMLKEIKSKLAKDGNLIIEVPHANDALLSKYKSEAFKQFTLWSEHLILHTFDSLTIMLEVSGFEVKSIQGVQRYDLANHLYWLSHLKPGGHQKWCNEFSSQASLEYAKSLERSGMSDTLMAVACLKK